MCAEYAQYGDDFFEKLVWCIKQGANPNVSASENNSPWFTPLGLALQGNRKKNINLLAPLTNKSIRNQLLTTKHPFSWYKPTAETLQILKIFLEQSS